MIRHGDDRLNGTISQRNGFIVARGVVVVQRQILRNVDTAILLDRDGEGDRAVRVSVGMSRAVAADTTDNETGGIILVQIDVMAVGGLDAGIDSSRHLQRVDERLRRKISADIEACDQNNSTKTMRIADGRRVCVG